MIGGYSVIAKYSGARGIFLDVRYDGASLPCGYLLDGMEAERGDVGDGADRTIPIVAAKSVAGVKLVNQRRSRNTRLASRCSVQASP